MKAYIKLDETRKILVEVKDEKELESIENGTYTPDEENKEEYLLGFVGGFEGRPALTEYADNVAYILGFLYGCEELKLKTDESEL